MCTHTKISHQISLLFRVHLCTFPHPPLYFWTKGKLNILQWRSAALCSKTFVPCGGGMQAQMIFRYNPSRNIFNLKLWVQMYVFILFLLDAICQPKQLVLYKYALNFLNICYILYFFTVICTFYQCHFTAWLFIVNIKSDYSVFLTNIALIPFWLTD